MLKELSVLGSLFLGLVIAGIIAIALIPSSKADNCACVNTENGAFLYSGKCVSDNLPRGTIFRTTTTICSSENLVVDRMYRETPTESFPMIIRTKEEMDEKEAVAKQWGVPPSYLSGSKGFWRLDANLISPKAPISDQCLYPDGIWRNCPITKRADMYKELSKLPVKEVLEGLADGYLSNTKSAEDVDKYIKELQRSHDLWTKNTFSLSSGSAGITSYSYCNVKGHCGPVPTDVIRDEK